MILAFNFQATVEVKRKKSESDSKSILYSIYEIHLFIYKAAEMKSKFCIIEEKVTRETCLDLASSIENADFKTYHIKKDIFPTSF